MKLIAFILFSLFSLSASASCSYSIKELSFGYGAGDPIKPKFLKEVKSKMEKKGYHLAKNVEETEFLLSLGAYSGHYCGTGLSFLDYILIPGGMTITFERQSGAIFLDETDHFDALGGTGGRMARNKIRKALKTIPSCLKN